MRFTPFLLGIIKFQAFYDYSAPKLYKAIGLSFLQALLCKL
jgi:hypothetical protein